MDQRPQLISIHQHTTRLWTVLTPLSITWPPPPPTIPTLFLNLFHLLFLPHLQPVSPSSRTDREVELSSFCQSQVTVSFLTCSSRDLKGPVYLNSIPKHISSATPCGQSMQFWLYFSEVFPLKHLPPAQHNGSKWPSFVVKHDIWKTLRLEFLRIIFTGDYFQTPTKKVKSVQVRSLK